MANLIQKRESKRYPGLFVKKYTRKVFFDALWNTSDELLEARGHVEDRDGNIVIRPFTKIFNRFENHTDIDRNETVVAIRKVNGFMAAATYVPSVKAVVVSTTGSLDSDFIAYAEKYITDEVKKTIATHYTLTGKARTWLFEICHPDDPHIIPEKEGAYLIGMRDVADDTPYFSTAAKEADLDHYAGVAGVLRPHWQVIDFGFITDAAKTCKHEGYVVYGQTSHTALKIKSPYYLTLKACARKADILSLDKTRVDEEYFGLIDFLKSNQDEFNAYNEQDRLKFITQYLAS